MMRKAMITLVLLATCLTGWAFDNDDYKAFAAQVRKEVWSRDMPDFKTRSVPAKYKNESAVILASYEEVSVDQKRKFSIYSSGYSVKQVNSGHLRRMLVKIQDKASLEKFSTFDYSTYRRQFNTGFGTDDVRNVLGVRVIKPDGSETEVSGDDYVSETEGKRGQEKKAKLAVPNLQVGDLIDVAAEIEKQEKELQHLEGFLAGIRKKLANENFVAHAPEAVVARERKKQSDSEEKIAALKESLAALKNK